MYVYVSIFHLQWNRAARNRHNYEKSKNFIRGQYFKNYNTRVYNDLNEDMRSYHYHTVRHNSYDERIMFKKKERNFFN